MVIPTDPANSARDEMRVPGVLPPHEHAVAAKDRRGGVALHDLLVGEVDLGMDSEAADDACDRVPRHLDQAAAPLGHQACWSEVGSVPVSGSGGDAWGPRQVGSRFIEARVNWRSDLTVRP